MIRKAVIPAAGMGTRLLSITKEIPKEMLPLIIRNSNRIICLKPVVQLVYEQLFNSGFIMVVNVDPIYEYLPN